MNIEVIRTATYVSENIEIDATVEKVYSIVSRICDWPDWQDNVTFTSINGSPEVNKEFHWKAGGVQIRSRLHTVNPPSEFGWTGKMLWISAVHNWSLKETNGKCLVEVEESLEGFLSGFMKKKLKDGMKENLKELKEAAESS